MSKIKVYIRHSFYSPNTALENRKRPEWFDKKKIWDNFKKTTNPEICDVTIIYDTHFGDSSESFFDETDNIVKINCGTEASSFLEMLNIIQRGDHNEDDIIYMLEDDYLHLPGWTNIMIEGLGLETDYISLYDHLDKYQYYPDLLSKIYVSESCHWRTVPSTCNTYACRFSTLIRDIDIHKFYSINHHNGISSDHSKFINLGNIGRRLITPMPGYSTHCDLLHSPTIKWENYI